MARLILAKDLKEFLARVADNHFIKIEFMASGDFKIVAIERVEVQVNDKHRTTHRIA